MYHRQINPTGVSISILTRGIWVTKYHVLTGHPFPIIKPPPSHAPRLPSNVVHEVNYKCEKKEKQIHLSYYLSDDERREVIQEIGDAACLTLEYYLRRAGRNKEAITDSIVAWHFGWTEQKAKRQRLALVKHGWFWYVKYTSHDGRKTITYYIGKEAVKNGKRT